MHLPCDECRRAVRGLRSAGTYLSRALISILLCSVHALAADAGEAVAEIHAFGQTLVLQTPFRSFDQRSATGPDGVLSRTQLTPKQDDPLYGRHSVEVLTVNRGAQRGLSAALIASTIQSQTTPFCPQTPQQLNLPAELDGVALISRCPAQSHLGGDLATVQVVFFGPRDLHMVIWTDLVRPPENITIDDPRWQQRVAKILPLHFCAPSADNPNMLNCVSPKQVKAARRQHAGESARWPDAGQ